MARLSSTGIPGGLFSPPALVQPAQDAAALLAAANAEHEAGQRAERAGLEHYRKAGEALLKAKAAAGHGKWLPLLKDRSSISNQRASEYMRLSAGWDKLPPGGSFGLKEALRIIDGRPAAQDRDEGEETLDDLAKQIREAHDLITMSAMRSLKSQHELGRLLSELFRRDEAAARAFLAEQVRSEPDARWLARWAERHGEGWEPTLRDAEKYIDGELDALLRRAGIDPDADDEGDDRA